MLTGHLPFDGDNTTGIALAHLHDAPEPMDEVAPEAQVDPAVEALVMALLAKDPDDRPTSAASVLRRLDTFIDHQAQKSGGTPSAVVLPAAPRPPRPVDTVVLPARRRFIVLAFSAGTALGFTLAILLR